MNKLIGTVLLGSLLAACAGKTTVNDGWDSSPKACDLTQFTYCTPLPQNLSKEYKVEAGLLSTGPQCKIQYYQITSQTPRVRIIFVHGALGEAANFRRQFARPIPNSILTSFDRPGFARSDCEKVSSELKGQAEVLVSFLKQKPQLPTLLVGHSYGGAIVVKAALAYPKLVQGVLLSGAILDPSQAAAYKAQNALALAPIKSMLPSGFKNTNGQLLHLKEDLEALAKELSLINVPVVWIHGSSDDVVNSSNTEYLKKILAAKGKESLLTVKIIPDLGHFIPDHNPEVFEEALKQLISRVVPDLR